MEKVCIKCNIKKDILLYSAKTSSKDGRSSICKKCSNVIRKEYSRTIKGVISDLYKAQKRNSKTRGHNPPEYTKKEFEMWIIQQEVFHKLHKRWKESGYEKLKKPSIDRLDNTIGYTFKNIEIVDWETNEKRAREHQRIGILGTISKHKPVIQLTKDGEFVNFFISGKEASRITGIDNKDISKVCNKKGRNKTAGGYKWVFALEQKI